MPNKKIILRISGMTCSHCEKRINDAVKKLKGVLSVSASFPKKHAEVVFEAEKITENDIKNAIEEEGYLVKSINLEEKNHPIGKVAPIFLAVIALYFIAKYTIGFDFINLIPKIDKSASLIALFATGLFTSVHCIAMCGGINLSQSVGSIENTEGRSRRPLLYNLGRVISYTVIGGIVGGIGSVLFVGITVKGMIMMIAAVFMILMSLSMLGWIPYWLVPRLPKKLTMHSNKAKKGKGPLVVGLLNGLLPCGPLQAMQLYALSTGSVLTGAFSMMLFSLGTVPLMLGAGVVFSMLKGRFTRGITRVSAVLVMLIAVIMVFNAGGLFGWNLNVSAGSQTTQTATGNNQPAAGSQTAVSNSYAVAQIKDGVQYVEAQLESSKYPSILVQKDIPVKFTIKAEKASINGCNGSVIFPQFNIQRDLQPGDNVFEFTPKSEGTISYTCWMGMIYGKIQVVSNLANADVSAAETGSSPAGNSSNSTQLTGSGSCCSGSSAATKFAGGKIPVDDIAVAEVKDGEQELTVEVNDQGYAPAVLVVQKGIKTKIKFDAEKLNSCNSILVFPEYNGELDLGNNEMETPALVPEQDFTFECGMGMLHGYVKVVDDINKIDLSAIKEEVSNFKPQSSGCCG